MEKDNTSVSPAKENNPDNDKSWYKSVVTQIIVGIVVGALLGYGGAMITINEKTTRLEEQVAQLREQIKSNPHSERNEQDAMHTAQSSKNVIFIRPDSLIDVIKEQQQKHVKRSCGTNAYECFTDDDLTIFTKKRIANQVASELRKKYEFIDLVKVIRTMRPAERQTLLERASNTSKRTWREIGYVTCEGQTEAGQTAELSIASSIVELIQNLVRLSDSEFESLYHQ